MSIFKKKKIEKELNVVTTPEDKAPVETFSKKKFYYFIS